LKLIAYGKVLDDGSKTLEELKLKEGDFLVAMVSKVKINCQCKGQTSSKAKD